MAADDTSEQQSIVNPLTKYGFGDLNPWAIATTSEDIDRNYSSFMGALGSSIGTFFEEGVFDQQHLFKAEVLFAWVQPGLTTIGESPNGPQIENAVLIKARIPELHTFPVPMKLPPANDPNALADWDLINQYPTYVAKDTYVNQFGVPQPGQIILVGYECKNPYRGPLYCGPVDRAQVFIPNPTPLPSATFRNTGFGQMGTVNLAPVNPKPLAPNELPENFNPGTYILFGDSQCRGALGKTVESRMREYGISPVTGFDRLNTSRDGAQIREWAWHLKIRRNLKTLHTKGFYNGGPNNGISGPATIEPLLKKIPNNIVWIGGGNSAGLNSPDKAMEDIIANIKRLAGPSIKITLIGPPYHFKKDTAGNSKRKKVADILNSKAENDEQVFSFSPFDSWKDQKSESTSDGVHLTAAGAKLYTDRLFPPREEPEQGN